MRNVLPGVGACLKKSVPGYARLHKNVTQPGSRLRMITWPGCQLRMVT